MGSKSRKKQDKRNANTAGQAGSHVETADRRTVVLIAIALVAITFLSYIQVFRNGFIVGFDDGLYVTKNSHVMAGLSAATIRWAFTTMTATNWHPITWLSHLLDCTVWHMNPIGHHLTSLLFHIANVLLLFWVLVRLTGSTWRSAIVAALFAIHPLHVESVAWVAERKDVLSAFFFLLTILAYFRYVKRPGTLNYLPIILLFALGLMAKPMLVSLPFILLLLDYWPLGRLGDRTSNVQRSTSNIEPSTILLEKVPLLLMSVASSVITFIAQKSGGAVESLTVHPIQLRIENAILAYADYLLKMVIPIRLGVLYPYQDHPSGLLIVLAGVFLAALTFLAVTKSDKHRFLTVGWLWYLLTLIPVIGLVQVGGQSMADRYTYIPSIGIFIAIAWGVPELIKSREILVVAAAIALIAFSALTWVQVGYWKDDVTLDSHTLDVTTDNSVIQNNLGNILLEKNDLDGAARYIQEALRINPNYGIAHSNMGVILQRQGRLVEARQEYQKALAINPKLIDALYNSGHLSLHERKSDEAAGYFRQVLQMMPEHLEAHINLSRALMNIGKPDEAEREAREALRIKPDSGDAEVTLGASLLRQRKLDEAVQHLSAAVRLLPDKPETHSELAYALHLSGRESEAVKEAHIYARLTGQPEGPISWK